MLFLRISPIVPNWVVNVANPIVGMPLHIFAFGTFFGINLMKIPSFKNSLIFI